MARILRASLKGSGAPSRLLMIVLDALLLVALFLLTGLSLGIVLRVKWPFSEVWRAPELSLSLTFLMAIAGIILCYFGHLHERQKRGINFFNRMLFFWILADGIVLLPSWWKPTITPPWNSDLFASYSSTILVDSVVSTNLLQVFYFFFVGTILGLALPFVASLVIRVSTLLYNWILYPANKTINQQAIPKPNSTQENAASGPESSSFLKFLGRCIFFLMAIGPTVFTLTGVKIDLTSGLTMSPGTVFFVSMTFVPVLVGIGHLLERIETEAKPSKSISRKYFETLMRISLLSGIISATIIVSRVVEHPSIDSLIQNAIAFYVPLLATCIPIFVLIRERQIMQKLYNFHFSALVGALFILLFSIWFASTQGSTVLTNVTEIIQPFNWFPVPQFNPYVLVMLGCLWMTVPLFSHSRSSFRELRKVPRTSLFWRATAGVLIALPFLFFEAQTRSIFMTEFWRTIVPVFYIIMILSGVSAGAKSVAAK
jgi:hypothetical protein